MIEHTPDARERLGMAADERRPWVEVKLKPAKTDVYAQLNEVALRQYAFKNEKVKQVACAIAKAFLEAPGEAVWADEIELPELEKESKNIIGICFRNLANWGLIQRLEGAGDHRRSKNKTRKGGVAWRYRTVSHKLLKTFLERNGVQVQTKAVQQNLL